MIVSAYSSNAKEAPALSKIDQLVADARTELKRLGTDVEGKRSDELLNTAREARNKSRGPRPK